MEISKKQLKFLKLIYKESRHIQDVTCHLKINEDGLDALTRDLKDFYSIDDTDPSGSHPYLKINERGKAIVEKNRRSIKVTALIAAIGTIFAIIFGLNNAHLIDLQSLFTNSTVSLSHSEKITLHLNPFSYEGSPTAEYIKFSIIVDVNFTNKTSRDVVVNAMDLNWEGTGAPSDEKLKLRYSRIMETVDPVRAVHAAKSVAQPIVVPANSTVSELILFEYNDDDPDYIPEPGAYTIQIVAWDAEHPSYDFSDAPIKSGKLDYWLDPENHLLLVAGGTITTYP